MSRASRLDPRQRRALRHAQKDAAASAVMTGLTDHYLAAYALHLKATPQQIAWLVAFPLLSGALSQLVAVWIRGRRWRRLTHRDGCTHASPGVRADDGAHVRA